jgi:hypothetical protein
MNESIANLVREVAHEARMAHTSPQARRNVEAKLVPALQAFDVLLAWCCGEISEGRACEELKVNRATLRAMRLDSVARGLGMSGGDMHSSSVIHKRAKALDRLNTFVREYTRDKNSHTEQEAILEFWNRMMFNSDFIARFEDWRAVCPPAQPYGLMEDKVHGEPD